MMCHHILLNLHSNVYIVIEEHSPKTQYIVVQCFDGFTKDTVFVFVLVFLAFCYCGPSSMSPFCLLFCSRVKTHVPAFIAGQLSSLSNIHKLLSLFIIQGQGVLQAEDHINGPESLMESFEYMLPKFPCFCKKSYVGLIKILTTITLNAVKFQDFKKNLSRHSFCCLSHAL